MHKARRDGLAGVLAVIQQAGGPGLVVASSGDRYTVGIQHDGQFGQLTPRWSLQLVEAWLYGYRDAFLSAEVNQVPGVGGKWHGQGD
jgi:hypothetical protein